MADSSAAAEDLGLDFTQWLLSPLLGVADYFTSLPLQPVFNTVHFILTAFALRNEPGGVQLAYRHPLASCIVTFLVASSGGLLANIALGRPLVECVLDPRVLATCIAAWYLVFFSPLDIFYGLCHFVPFNLALWVLKELSRAKKVYAGVRMASALYPQSILAMAVVGMFKGSGKQWGITWYHLVFNPQAASKHELLSISLVTKSSMAFSLLLALNHAQPTLDPSLLVLLGGCTFVALRLRNILVRHTDPFTPVQLYVWEKLTCLCVTHPHREVGIMTTRARDAHTSDSGRGQERTTEAGDITSERSDVTVQSVTLGEGGVNDDGSRTQESLRQRKVQKSSDESSGERANSEEIEGEGEQVTEGGGESGKDSPGEEPVTIGSGGGDDVDDEHLKRD